VLGPWCLLLRLLLLQRCLRLQYDRSPYVRVSYFLKGPNQPKYLQIFDAVWYGKNPFEKSHPKRENYAAALSRWKQETCLSG